MHTDTVIITIIYNYFIFPARLLSACPQMESLCQTSVTPHTNSNIYPSCREN